MRRPWFILIALLGLILLAAPPVSAAVAASIENRVSGSPSVSNNLIGIEPRLSEEPVREKVALAYELASDDAVAARGTLVTAEGTASAAQAARLSRQLASQEIAGGHAFTKHVVEGGEFLGVRTRAEFASVIENTMGGVSKALSGGRTAYWKDGADLDIVARSLRAAADGTFFPDWEFETLTGATRNKIRTEADAWLGSVESSPKMRELALSVISNLLGYPHEQRSELEALIGADSAELNALLRKLSA